MKPVFRRDILQSLLGGAGVWAIRSAATGLPAAFLMNPLGYADAAKPSEVDPAKAQFAVLVMSDAGEPINNNGPGSYDFPDMVHAADPALGPAPLRLGTVTTTAAQVWSTLPQWVLDRTMFMHHTTFSDNHGTLGGLIGVYGKTKAGEILPSIFAKHLGPALKTIQSTPIAAGVGDVLSAGGLRIPNTPPQTWRQLVVQYAELPAAMQQIRDKTISRIHQTIRARGTPAQLKFLDRLAKSGAEAKRLGDSGSAILSTIKDNGNDGQLTAAVAIIKMNITPVVGIALNFGMDNHSDVALTGEAANHKNVLASLNAFFSLLRSNGLEDRVTLGYLGVFGRNFKAPGLKGRDHWGPHCTSFVVGKNVRAGVYGGTIAGRGDYMATGMDSATGAAVIEGGDIVVGNSLASLTKTIGAALGIPAAVLDDEILAGRIVKAAVV
jgi:hypothetical protein